MDTSVSQRTQFPRLLCNGKKEGRKERDRESICLVGHFGIKKKREIRFTYPSTYTDTSDPMHNAGVAISNAVA